jgi:SpoVK/Ycf46/Vps4 family AAA+-type ATPase
MITIMEDLDALVQQHGDHGFLALLDGETQISNVVHVATTNYPEYLDKRFVDRPSRFDTIMRVGMPSPQARRVYFKAKESSLDDVTLERWVKRTDDYSIAHLREVIIAIKCFGQNEDAVFNRLDGMRQQKIESDGSGGQRAGVGFVRGPR